MSDKREATAENVNTDQKILRQLLQAAVDVELFTIPLYMTSLYSIQGFTVVGVEPDMQWPGRSPQLVDERASRDERVTQQAFNIIYSVYIQEMFHLQLAGNIAKAAGLDVSLEPPVYDGSSVIPYVGDLKTMKVKGRGTPYADVKVRLGPVDENQVKLFMAIEEPDWDVGPGPHLPLTGPVTPNTTFGSIGHLYEAIIWYMNRKYSDCSTLWSHCYKPHAPQLDAFRARDPKDAPRSDEKEEYTFPVTFTDCTDADKALQRAITMIHAIVDEGEGGPLFDMLDRQHVVPREFRPNAKILEWFASVYDMPRASAQVQASENAVSHFDRFRALAESCHEVVTWSKWRAAHGPWRASDFIKPGVKPTREQKQDAERRAKAYNDREVIPELDRRLSLTFTSLLNRIADDWNEPQQPNATFPIWAMLGVSSRVKALWAAGGQPTFQHVAPPTGDLHACQGLNPHNPGNNCCATAIDHTCATANSCANQGGCGYPIPSDDGFPDVNIERGLGGCGTPIPDAQVFQVEGVYPFCKGPSWSYTVPESECKDPGNCTVTMNGKGTQNPDKVWEKAWEIFVKKHPEVKGKKIEPASVRVVLPPS